MANTFQGYIPISPLSAVFAGLEDVSAKLGAAKEKKETAKRQSVLDEIKQNELIKIQRENSPEFLQAQQEAAAAKALREAAEFQLKINSDNRAAAAAGRQEAAEGRAVEEFNRDAAAALREREREIARRFYGTGAYQNFGQFAEDRALLAETLPPEEFSKLSQIGRQGAAQNTNLLRGFYADNAAANAAGADTIAGNAAAAAHYRQEGAEVGDLSRALARGYNAGILPEKSRTGGGAGANAPKLTGDEKLWAEVEPEIYTGKTRDGAPASVLNVSRQLTGSDPFKSSNNEMLQKTRSGVGTLQTVSQALNRLRWARDNNGKVDQAVLEQFSSTAQRALGFIRGGLGAGKAHLQLIEGIELAEEGTLDERIIDQLTRLFTGKVDENVVERWQENARIFAEALQMELDEQRDLLTNTIAFENARISNRKLTPEAQNYLARVAVDNFLTNSPAALPPRELWDQDYELFKPRNQDGFRMLGEDGEQFFKPFYDMLFSARGEMGFGKENWDVGLDDDIAAGWKEGGKIHFLIADNAPLGGLNKNTSPSQNPQVEFFQVSLPMDFFQKQPQNATLEDVMNEVIANSKQVKNGWALYRRYLGAK